MFKGPNNLRLSHTPSSATILFKIALGVAFIAFLLSYQPALGTFPPTKQNIVHAQENQQVESIIPSDKQPVFQLPHPGYLSTHYSSWHPGIDIATGLGMPIKPISEGTVTEAGYNFWGLGLVVEIQHPSGYHSLYAHMGKVYVKKGQTVTDSDYIGEVGLTGHTTGPHTHLEVKKDESYLDPSTILPALRNYPVEADLKAYPKNSEPKEVTYEATPTAILSKPINKPLAQTKLPEKTPTTQTLQTPLPQPLIPQITEIKLQDKLQITQALQTPLPQLLTPNPSPKPQLLTIQSSAKPSATQTTKTPLPQPPMPLPVQTNLQDKLQLTQTITPQTTPTPQLQLTQVLALKKEL